MSRPNIEAIKQRLADRRKPQIGTCSACDHQQEMATPGMAYASSMAEAMWRCQKCGGPITVMFTTTTGPYVDDDLHDLIAEIERLHLAAGLVPPPWEDIGSAPTDGTEVLTFQPGEHGDAIDGYYNVAASHGDESGWQVIGEYTVKPSHWLPLPSSPLRSLKEP